MNDDGYTKYNYCEGIKSVAYQSAFLVPSSGLSIAIDYDHGPGGSAFVECNNWNSTQVDNDVVVESGDRVNVTVTAQYEPMLKLIPITGQTIISKSSRTIFGIIDLDT